MCLGVKLIVLVSIENSGNILEIYLLSCKITLKRKWCKFTLNELAGV